MTLPELLLPQNPFRPWVFTLGACLLACLPRRTRRIGAILLLMVAGAAALDFFLDYTFKSFAPGG